MLLNRTYNQLESALSRDRKAKMRGHLVTECVRVYGHCSAVDNQLESDHDASTK